MISAISKQQSIAFYQARWITLFYSESSKFDEKQLAEAERYTAKFPVFKPAAAVITSAEKEVPYVPL